MPTVTDTARSLGLPINDAGELSRSMHAKKEWSKFSVITNADGGVRVLQTKKGHLTATYVSNKQLDHHRPLPRKQIGRVFTEVSGTDFEWQGDLRTTKSMRDFLQEIQRFSVKADDIEVIENDRA